MTPEARLAFVLFFVAVWCFLGLLAWCAAAILARGRGALPALPLALAAACVGGIVVPLIGLDDAPGFLLSLFTAFFAGAAGAVGGIALARRLWPEKASRSSVGAATTSTAEGERSGRTTDS
jgi:hypothetical protein